jgi:hypothetical protein
MTRLARSPSCKSILPAILARRRPIILDSRLLTVFRSSGKEPYGAPLRSKFFRPVCRTATEQWADPAPKHCSGARK